MEGDGRIRRMRVSGPVRADSRNGVRIGQSLHKANFVNAVCFSQRTVNVEDC
jgi:hypothetical protein